MSLIHNWNLYPIVDANVATPLFAEDIQEALTKGTSMIARGNGRCYGDASLGKHVLSTLKLRHILAFDESKGIMRCQSGALLSDILQLIVPRGWYLPVTPGTQYITVGGALASDVHGKNHHKEGSFSDYVLAVSLVLPNGSVQVCSPTSNPELFWFTAGGMGLTGIITEVTFKLKHIESPFISQIQHKARNLDEIFDLIDQYHNSTYSVAWIDCLKGGKSAGRSVLILGEHTPLAEVKDRRWRRRRVFTVPFFMPSFTLNPFTVRAFNSAIYARNFKKILSSVVSYDSYFYPLDSVLDWNKIYGKKGFIQYQFVVPRENGKAAVSKIMARIRERGLGSFLAVLKAFGPGTVPLAFQMEGYTLALDIPLRQGLFPFLDQLDEMVRDFGGRIYLSKDARMKSEIFFSTYPRSHDFAQFVSSMDPEGVIQSGLSKRLKIK